MILKRPKLSARLSMLAELAVNTIETHSLSRVWDLCCDHGYLGQYLLFETKRPICFVDKVPRITDTLNLQMKHLSLPESSYQVLPINASSILLDPSEKHLLILAGVGGDIILDIITSITERHPDQQIYYLLCPNYHWFLVRSFLQEKAFSLINESMVVDAGRLYDGLLVKTHQVDQSVVNQRIPFQSDRRPLIVNESQKKYQSVSLTGQAWQKGNPEHIACLDKMVAHYRRKSDSNRRIGDNDALVIYQALLSSLCG